MTRRFDPSLRAAIASPWLVLMLILGATVLYYAPTLDDWFFADDFLFLRQSQTTGWGDWIVQSFDYRDSRPLPDISQYRPMYALTFKLEYEIFGMRAWGYHAVNLAVHLASVTFLWLIARRLPMPLWAAHLAALIFALHPTYTEAVAWIANGNTPMAVCFALLGILLFMMSCEGPRTRLLLTASVVSFTLGLLYHPVVLPYAAVIPLWYFLLHRRPTEALQPARWLPAVPFIAIALPYAAIHRWVREHDYNEQVKYQFGDHMWRIGIDYLGLAWNVMPDSDTAPFAVAATIAATIVVLLPLEGRLPALGMLAAGWYYAALGPDTLYIFGAFNRLMYAPGAPLALMLAAAAAGIVRLFSDDRVAGAPLAARSIALASVAAAVLVLLIAARPRGRDLPPNASLVSRESRQNERFMDQLRRDIPSMPRDGTLYVVNPPGFTVHLGLENILRSMVRIEYGEIAVEPVPLRAAPFLDEGQVRAQLRPEDRIFVFAPGVD